MVADAVKEKFFEDNEEYREVKGDPAKPSIGDIQSIDEIEDEVFLMQCPKGFDPTTLRGEKMKLPGRTTIDASNKEFEALSVEFEKPEKHAFAYTNRKGRYALRLLPVCGSIVVRNKLTANSPLTAEQIHEVTTTKSLIPKKPMIKVRHPLLGSMFQNELKKVSPKIAERLKQADAQSLQVMHEARQKANPLKRSRTKEDDAFAKPKAMNATVKQETPDDYDTDVQFVSRTEPTKKKKKHKKSKQDVELVAEDLQWIKEL